MLGSTWNAKRFAGKPMRQPAYNFENVPKAQRSLEGSTVERVENREHFIDAMGELVLLCNQAMKRAGASSPIKKSSKPLSLEYIADRLDVDDPIWGYVARDKSTRAMQGFITCTTFTNWQKSFRWDSMHDSAFAYDPPQLAKQVISGDRVVDRDGSLAAALQSCVKCGDMWNEGIVSPRIAEISLLGALGCGKALLSMVLEELEGMPPSATHNYDYVVLQATENSVSFYESMGFVRVGCVTEDDKFEEKQRRAQCSDTETDESSLYAADPADSSSSSGADDKEKQEDEEEKSEIVSSPVIEYTVVNPGETPTEIANSLNVDVWDVVFLNHFVYKDINPRSRLMKDTTLYVPSSKSAAMARTRAEHPDDLKHCLFTAWYVAAENDTPKMIAKKFGLNCADIVAGNRGRLPDLQGVSRLKEGTRIKVSRFDEHDDKFVPYCHWSFPDDTFEHADPSYMMARKLNRSRKRKNLSLDAKKYKAPPASLYAVAEDEELDVGEAPETPPRKPKRPANPYMLYTSKVRQSVTDSMEGAATSKVIRHIATMWKELPDEEKETFVTQHQAAKARYKLAKDDYDKQMEAYFRANPKLREQGDTSSLFNKVVRLREHEATKPHDNFDYYYVLTYIPDLKWAHLAPMKRVGYWESSGRPVWMLVDEKLGKEVDISSSFCVPVAAKAVKHTVDADREQWDIYESGPGLKPAPVAARETSECAVAPTASRSATKPLGGKLVKRKYAELDPSIFSPNVVKRPHSGSAKQRVVHRELPPRQAAPASFSDSSPTPKNPNRGTPQTPQSEIPQKRKRGRPPKTKSPIESPGVLNSLAMDPGALLFDDKGEVIQIKRGRGRPLTHPLAPEQQVRPVKRGRGRPPKNEMSAPTKKRGRPRKRDAASQEPPKKRGRGRPPKKREQRKDEGTSLEPQKKRVRGCPRKGMSPSKDILVNQTGSAKRGRGRPPKHQSTPERGPGRSPKNGTPTPKRGRGRPPKNNASTAKRGQDRAPKVADRLEQPEIEDRSTGAIGSPSRNGRARKTPDFFKPPTPTDERVAVFNQKVAYAGNRLSTREKAEPRTELASKNTLKASVASGEVLVKISFRPRSGGWTGSPRLRQLPNRKTGSIIDETAIAARRARTKADPSSPLLVGRRMTRGR